MLAYVLAIAVAFISFAFYMAAFFFPEVHRKDDFLWSGVGLFYALVLWVCAGRITGGVLLGQLAGVALVFWLGWETLTLRRAIAYPEARTEIDESFSLTETLQTAFGKAFSLLRRQAPDPKPSLEKQTEAVADVTQAEPQIPTSEPVPPIIEEAPSATPQPAESAVTTDEPAKAEQATPIEDTSPLETPQSPPTQANKPKRAFPNFFRRVPRPSERQPKNEPTPPTAPTGEAIAQAELVPTERETTDAPSEATPPQPPTAEMVEAAQAEVNQPPQIDVEEIAPEAQLTPPAEPTGDGDPQVRQELQSSLEEPDTKKTDAAESP